MISLMNLLLLLLFSWLVVRHMQEQMLQEQNPAQKTDLVERDLQKVGAIAAIGFGYLQRFVAIGFGFLRGLADMTAALLLAVWKMLNAQQTKSYRARFLIAASALGRMLRGFALRMRKGNFSKTSLPLINPEISPEEGDQAPPDSAESQAVAYMGDLLEVYEVMHAAGTDPDTVVDPEDASAAVIDVYCAPYIDPDEEATEYVEALRKGFADGSAVGSPSLSEAAAQPPLPSGASDCGGLPVLNAESNLGPIEFTEAAADTSAVEPSQLPELGFGAAAKPAQELAKQGNRKRKAGAVKTAGRNGNVPDSVQRSARQLPRQDAGARRPSVGGRRGNR